MIVNRNPLLVLFYCGIIYKYQYFFAAVFTLCFLQLLFKIV